MRQILATVALVGLLAASAAADEAASSLLARAFDNLYADDYRQLRSEKADRFLESTSWLGRGFGASRGYGAMVASRFADDQQGVLIDIEENPPASGNFIGDFQDGDDTILQRFAEVDVRRIHAWLRLHELQDRECLLAHLDLDDPVLELSISKQRAELLSSTLMSCRLDVRLCEVDGIFFAYFSV